MGALGNGMKLLILAVVFFVIIIMIARNKSARKILGSILGAGGAIGVVYGLVQLNSTEAKFNRLLGNNNPSEFATFILIVGAIALIAGIILLALSGNTYPKFQAKNTETNIKQESTLIKVRCAYCKELNNENSKLCSGCGKSLSDEDAL